VWWLCRETRRYRYLNELQDKVCVFAVEFGGQAVQAAAQPVLVHHHQLLALGGQLHADAKLTLPVGGNEAKFNREIIEKSEPLKKVEVSLGVIE